MKKLYLITGFLGAGKTTLINKLFSVFKDKKTAVIVNEFGKTGIDGNTLTEKGYKVTEINSGSIFCVCRSDMFMDALRDASKSDADILLVETSGLSDPTGMDSILENLKKISNIEYNYCGCICILDADNFIKVYNTAVVVPSQIRKASLVVVNKIDCSTSNQIEMAETAVRKLNPYCDIIYTTYSDVPKEKILNLKPIENLYSSNSSNKVDILSTSLTVDFSQNVSLEDVKQLLSDIKNMIYRCKGYLKTLSGDYFIDGVMDKINITKIKSTSELNSLVILYNAKYPVRKSVKEFCKNLNCSID